MDNLQEEISKSGISRRVLITTSYYEPAHLGGGPIQTLKALVHAAPERFDIDLTCMNHDLGRVEPLVEKPNTWLPLGKIRIRYIEGGVRNLFNAFKTSRNLDILYLNSLFDSKFSLFPMILWRLGTWKNATVLVAPRGQLDPGALALKSGKKKVFLKLFKLSGFPSKFVWHASSEIEASHVRENFGPKTKVVIRENETSLPLQAKKREPRKSGPFRLVFTSRLSEKKGLHTLLAALKSIDEPIDLRIIGAFEESGYEQKCQQLANDLPENISAVFLGGLPRNALLTELHKADLFAFPTAGENFGHVIAEALSQSCPIMCSPHTPWSNTLNNGGGIVVKDNDSQSWQKALTSFISGGNELWVDAANMAGESFSHWRNESKGKHVFEIIEGLP